MQVNHLDSKSQFCRAHPGLTDTCFFLWTLQQLKCTMGGNRVYIYRYRYMYPYLSICMYTHTPIPEVEVKWTALLKVRRPGSPEITVLSSDSRGPQTVLCVPRHSRRTEQLVASAVVKGVRVTLWKLSGPATQSKVLRVQSHSCPSWIKSLTMIYTNIF